MFENLFFLIFGGILLFMVVFVFRAIWNTVAEKRYNDSQPILTERARISAKRSELHGGGNSSVSTDYYATFEFDKDKSRLELEIDSDDFGLIAEDDTGNLTFQGRRFIKFERM